MTVAYTTSWGLALGGGNKLLAGGTELDEVCRHLQIADSTWHRWVAQYGGIAPGPLNGDLSPVLTGRSASALPRTG